ncbi:hypothetical protein [Enterococcus sp. AZ163]|uniref:hypothetical protein n=1 Tax=Enterococcus sp. AZ163 TaxID=2774638 RepID=UPI003D2A1FAD
MNKLHLHRGFEKNFLREHYLYNHWQNGLDQTEKASTFDSDGITALLKASGNLTMLALFDPRLDHLLLRDWGKFDRGRSVLVCPRALDKYCSSPAFMANRFVPPSPCLATA